MEIWKDIKGYEGLYQVSNFGRVINCKRNSEMKAIVRSNGYLSVNLTKDGKCRTLSIHRLIAEAFIPNPQGLPCINHIDENKCNNSIENLEWCTYRENTQKYMDNHPEVFSEYNGRPRIKRPHKHFSAVEQMTMSGEPVKVWKNVSVIKHEMGWSDWSIAECCRGNRHSAYGYKWRYAT